MKYKIKNIYAIVICLILSLAIGKATSDVKEFTLGTGTGVTTGTLETPFGTYYMDGRTQYLITASELLARGAKKGGITYLSFDVVKYGGKEMNNMQLSIGSASASSLSSYQNSLTTVYSGHYNPTTGWNRILFEQPFLWDGISNIVIQVCFDNSSYVQNSTVRYTTTGVNTVYGDYKDYRTQGGCSLTSAKSPSKKRPNIKLGIEENIYAIDKDEISGYNYIHTIVPRVETKDEIEDNHLRNPTRLLEAFEYYDGLGRPIQNISVASSPGYNDIVQHIDYDDFGREDVMYLPYVIKDEWKGQSYVSGSYRTNAETEQENFYDPVQYPNENYATDDAPWAVTVFEQSPLNRIIEQGAPGTAWQPTDEAGHNTVKYNNTTNVENTDKVIIWTAGDAQDNITMLYASISGRYYSTGELYVKTIEDENGNISKEYTDKEGKVILKENSLGGRTYYVYDDFDLLRFVLPPKFSKNYTGNTLKSFFSDAIELKDLCYFYKYDKRKRMIEKRLPGAEPVYMTYDKRDRLVATQDGNQRSQSPPRWSFTKYDVLNRPVMTGEITNTYSAVLDTQEEMQEYIDGYYGYHQAPLYEKLYPSAYHFYTNNSFPCNSGGVYYRLGFEVYTVTYYDNYDFKQTINEFDLRYNFTSNPNTSGLTGNYNVFGSGFEKFDNPVGHITGTKTLILGSDEYLNTVIYYDEYGRAIQSISKNFLSGADWYFDRVSTKYNFAGEALASITEHNFNIENCYDCTDPQTIGERFVYDHSGRLLEHWHMIDGNATGEILLTAIENNEPGESVEKYLHTPSSGDLSAAKQKIDYRYNIRGWLKSINNPTNLGSDLFAMNLLYNDISSKGGLKTGEQYNGNIAAVIWNDAHSNTLKGYGFKYDALNRLKEGDYSQGNGLPENYSPYDMAVNSYDENGNIINLWRLNANAYPMDVLHYTYHPNSNQLKAVSDDWDDPKGFNDGANAAEEYMYDANGNMVVDKNKKIVEIKYNLLNLPSTIKFEMANEVQPTIYYEYAADGTKLLNKNQNNNYTAYIGNFVYKDGKLDYILHSEGRILPSTIKTSSENSSGQMIEETTTTYSYEYFLKDHIGNTRVAFNENGDIVQATDYFPFGMQHPSSGLANGTQKYLYNGKELQEGTDWLDYGNRFYDATLGRWHVQDRFAEKYYPLTPYQYGANNPINVIDINGDSTYLVIYSAGYLNYQYQGQGHDVGNGFKENAEAHAETIRNRPGFDPKRDAVVVVEGKSTEQFTDATNATYGTGKIAEMTVFSHGYEGGVSLGGQSPNDPGVTQADADAQLNDYDKREINDNTMSQIDKSNFEDNARTTFMGCNIGGYTNSSSSGSFGQSFADYMGGNRTVKAFTGGAEFTTSGGRVTYSGRMIRSKDRASQQTRLTTFQKNQNPKLP